MRERGALWTEKLARDQAVPVLFYRWHPVIVAFVLIIAYMGPGVLAQLHDPAGPIHGDIGIDLIPVSLLTLVLFVAEAVGFVISACRRKLKPAMWQTLTIALLAGSMVFGHQVDWVVQYADLFIFSSIFMPAKKMRSLMMTTPNATFAARRVLETATLLRSTIPAIKSIARADNSRNR